MKPIALKMKGINSFLEEQLIDFKTLTSRGIFGIFGPTGSGKTSILDGITLSLYGDISRNTKDFINANTDTAYVSFEFEMSDLPPRRYRIEREFKRNKTGGVTTKYAKMLAIEEEGPVVLEDRPLKVNDQCEAVIGLTKEDFTRTVVLPQGKFSEFLKLKNKDRGEMLERIFNLQQYGDQLTSKLSNHAKHIRLQDTALSGQLKAYEGLSREGIVELENLLKAKAAAHALAMEQKQIMDKAFAEIEVIWQLQRDLEQLNRSYEAKKGQSDHFVQVGEQLRRAEEAQGLVGSITHWETLRDAVIKLKDEMEQAEKAKAESLLAYDQAKILFELAQKGKEQRLPILEAEINRLTEGMDKARVLEEQSQNLEQLKRHAYELRVQLNNHQETVKKYQSEQERLEESLKLKLLEGEPLKSSHEEKQVIEGLFHQFQSLEAEDLRLKALLDKKERLEERMKVLEEERLNLQKAFSSAKALQDNNRDQQLLLEQALKGVPEQLLSLSQERQTAENQMHQWEEVQRQVKEIESNLERTEPQILQGYEVLERLKSQSRELDKALETLKKVEYAITLRQALVKGQACMVCGSIEHPAEHEIIAHEPLEEGQKEAFDQLQQTIETQEKQLTVLETRKGEWLAQLKKWKDTEQSLGRAFLETTPAMLSKTYKDLETKWQADQEALQHCQRLAEQQQEQLSQCEKSLASIESGMKVEKLQGIALAEEEDHLSTQIQTQRSLLLMKQAQQGILDVPSAYEKMKTNEEQLEKIEKAVSELRVQLEETVKALDTAKAGQQTLSEETVSAETQWKVQRDVYEKEKTALIEQVGPLETLTEQLMKGRTEAELIRQTFESEKAKEKIASEALQRAQDVYLTTENSLKLQSEQLVKAKETLEGQVSESIFETVDEVKSSLLAPDARQSMKGALSTYQEETQRLQGAVAQLEGKLDGRRVETADYEAKLAERLAAETNLQTLGDERVKLKTQLEQLKSQYEVLKDLLEEKAKLDVELAYISDLEKLFQGKRFVGYIAIHQLIYVSGKASEQLMDISQGNYGLEIDEEGNFMIRDYKNGGVLRDPSSLSGGETFMVSLSLALALSAQIQLKGTAPLEFFFLDEGFGTLDEETLDVVMTALERLHHEKLSIGLISHVDSIKNRVPVQLNVSPARAGISGSRVKVELS